VINQLFYIKKGGVMKTVIYKTASSIFEFDQSDVFERLKYHKKEMNSYAAEVIEKHISDFGFYPIIIPNKYDYFANIVLELIEDGKGSIKCKICDQTYQASELISIPVGHGKSPINKDHLREIQGLKLKDLFRKKWIKIAIDNFKDLFHKKQPQPGLIGGKGFTCPQNHELISQITWLT